MCWIGKCDVKIAERDFYVYKLGHISYKNFRSLYQKFIYKPKEINKKISLDPVCIDFAISKSREETPCVIYEGYHSYKDITMPYSDLHPFYRIIYLGKLAKYIKIFNIYCIATFIIPKGSKYYENDNGEIVSSDIIYTGKYVKIGNSEE